MQRRVLLLGLAAACAAPLGAHASDSGPPLPPPLSRLAGAALTRPDGAPTTLGAELAPGPAIVSFWATWCAPCLAEGRHLARLRTRIPPEQLNIVGVNLDRDRDEVRLAAFIARAGMNYTQLRGDVGLYRAFGQSTATNQLTLPRLFVFDADGAPVAAFGRYSGGRTLRAIDAAVAAVLG